MTTRFYLKKNPKIDPHGPYDTNFIIYHSFYISDDFLTFDSMVHLVSTQKLDSTNYLIWFSQVEPILICFDLKKLCDGTTKPLPITIPSSTNVVVSIVNLAYME